MKKLLIGISLFLVFFVYHYKAGALKEKNNKNSYDAIVKLENYSNGPVYIAFFKNPDGYPEASSKSFKRLQTSENNFVVKNLPLKIAVVAFIDKNENQELDKNIMGVPSEPYTFSNSKGANLTPPSFNDALVPTDKPIVLEF